MSNVDLGPATERVGHLLAGISDEQLGVPTPCPAYRLGDLVEHVGGLSLAFAAAAHKTPIPMPPGGPPAGDAARLGDDWRERIPADLRALAEAWRAPSAWEGETSAGGIDMPSAIAGLVALDEVVVHGWDIAKATGQPYDVDQATLEVLHDLVVQFAPESESGEPVVNDGTMPFGPAVPVAADAPLLDRVLGLVGRDPAWAPSR